MLFDGPPYYLLYMDKIRPDIQKALYDVIELINHEKYDAPFATRKRHKKLRKVLMKYLDN